MEINIQLADDFLTANDVDRLRRLLRVESGEPSEAALHKLVMAALAEYKEMLLGMGLASRASEIREHRLLCLIRYYFKERIPSEAEVGSIFRLTESASRSLIRSVTSKFEQDLRGQVDETLKRAIAQPKFSKDRRTYRVMIQSDNVVEELNRIIEREGPGRTPVTGVRGMSRMYDISEGAYKVLCEQLGVSADGQNLRPSQ